MSSILAVARPQGAPEREPRAPHLEVAASRAQRAARPRLVYAVIVIGGIGVILLAQLLLSIVVADGAYTLSGLRTEQRDLSRQERDLGEQLEVKSSTQNLTANAEALGMVASGNPVFLDAATGAVSGTPTAAGGSLLGSRGNMIGNSLLTGGSVVDPEALAQAQADADAAATQGMAVEDPESGSPIETDGAPGTDAGSTAIATDTGAGGATAGTATGTTGATGGSTIPSPTTR